MQSDAVKSSNVQTRFLLNVLKATSKLKQFRRYYFHLNTPKQFSLSPNLLLDKNSMTFEFSGGSSRTSDEHIAQVTFDQNVFADNYHKNAPSQKTLAIKLGCSCDTFSNMGICNHTVRAVSFLDQKIKDTSAAAAIKWMQSCICDEQAMGEKLLEDLRRSANPQETDEQFRVQWRLVPPDPNFPSENCEIVCYLQKTKLRGSGWTNGRKIRNALYDVPRSAYRHPDDYFTAALLDIADSTEPMDGKALVKALELLKDRPDFCWDLEDQPAVKVIRSQPAIEFVEQDGHFQPVLSIDGKSFSEYVDVPHIETDSHCVIIPDVSGHTLRYFELSREQLGYLRVIQRATRHGLKLNPAGARELTQIVCQSNTAEAIIARMPEALAGPEIALPAKIELHLVPRTGGGLEARLRVACEGLDTPPVPGIGSGRLLVQTLAGPCQYLRDLPGEIAAAEDIATMLGMGEYPFDGPYTWLSDDIEPSMQLLQKCRQLGASGPTVCWPASKPMRLLGEITPQCLKVRLTSERDWFGLEGELCLDGLQVPLAELFAVLRSGARFVPLGEGGFATISEDLRQRLALMDDIAYPERSGLTVSRAAAGMIKQAIGEDIPAEIDQRWRDAVERLNDRTKVPQKPPKGLIANLRDYQMAGYQWLSQLSHWGLGGCLADDMGLGKTIQALGILIDRAPLGPALVIAPTSVGCNWQRETEKFAPGLKPHLYREHERDELIQNATEGDLVIASYQIVQRDIKRFASRQWATLILDEAQYIKNFQTKTCAAIRQLDAQWSLALTGTPLENHLGELWSLMRVISPGLLGSWERFRTRFAEPIERGKDHQRLLALGKILRPFMLRRTKKEVLTELPPRTEVLQVVELSDAERKRYDAARLAALAELTSNDKCANDQQHRIRILAWLTRLRQLACHPGLVDPRWKKSSAKLEMFMQLANELVEGKHRALVFSQFVQHLSLVRAELDSQGISYQYLDGSTPPAKRQAAVDAFQRGEGDLFLISLKAGGTGLNLTGADYVLHLDPWWNPAVEDQATDRAHRIGQTQKVTVFRLVAKDTIEEQILSLHASKRELIAGVLDGADRAAKLSTRELVDLIRLGTSIQS